MNPYNCKLSVLSFFVFARKENINIFVKSEVIKNIAL